MPGETKARIEVVVVTLVQAAGRVDDGARPAGDFVPGGGIEVRHQPVLGVERALIGVPNTPIDRQGRRELPVILEIEAIDRGTRQPTGEFAAEDGLRYVARQKTGKRVARVGNRAAVRLQTGRHIRERILDRVSEIGRIQTEAEHFVASLEGVCTLYD